MMEIQIDDREVERALRHLPEQVPFAMSLAINDCAWKARDALKADLPSHFTLRTAYTLSGLTAENGTKKTLDAKVGELDSRWWMAAHATGDEARKPPTGVNHIAETEGDGAPRPNAGKVVPRGFRLDRIDKAKHGGIAYFVFRKEGKAIGMFYRSGAERAPLRKTMKGQALPATVRPKYPIEKAYTFASEVRIRPDWPMEAVVAAVVQKDWSEAVQRAVEKAIKTAKK